jgi:Phage gp6-like head-tail connector protein
MDLVLLEDAKTHLKIFDTAHDAEVTARLADSTAWVIGYLNLAEAPAWDPITVPGDVRAAVLLHVTMLWVHRDDWNHDGIESGTHAGIANVLRQRRVQAIG